MEPKLTTEEYNDLALRAFQGDKAAAEELIPEAVARGDAYDPDVVLAWAVAYGPFRTGEGEIGDGSLEAEAFNLINKYGGFSTPEAIFARIDALREKGDLIEHDGKLGVPGDFDESVQQIYGVEAEAPAAMTSATTWKEYASKIRRRAKKQNWLGWGLGLAGGYLVVRTGVRMWRARR